VLDCPAADREARIAELCNDAELAQDPALAQPDLAQRVRRWVTGHEPTGQALSPEELLGPDNRIAGRFRIQSFLGRGGMGEVYAVEDTELGGRIALKMIHPNLLGDPETAARFRREIQLARQVTHPNVCRVFDVGKDMVNGQERLFLTMEYLHGEVLSHYLQEHGELSPEEALALVRQMADGLDALHARGIIHRDLKPGNVMLVESPSAAPRLVIADFGLAREMADGAQPLTRPLAILGTPAYMAPEQLLGEPATAASDIYAFGLMAFEIATGHKIATGRWGPELMARVTEDIVFPEAKLPPGWEPALRRCLDRKPAARPRKASEFVEMLALPAVSVGSGTVRTEVQQAGRSWRIPVASFAALVIAAGLGIVYRQHSLRDKREPTIDPADTVRDLLVRYDKPGNPDLTIAQLAKANANGPHAALIHYELGLARYQKYLQGLNAADLDQAKAESLESIRLDADFPDAHTTLARIYARSGRMDLAEPEVREALRLDPRSANAWAALGSLFSQRGRSAEAREALQKAVDLAPDDWRWHKEMGIYLRDSGKLEEARKEFQTATQLTPDNSDAFNDLGNVLILESRFNEARGEFEHAIQISPQYRYYSGLGTALILESNYPGALSAFQQAVDLNPKSYMGWANLGAAASWTPGQKNKASEAYRKAIALAEVLRQRNPKDTVLLSRLGGFYAATDNPEKAIPLLRQAVALSPDSPEVTYRAGEAYEILHHRDEALRWVLKAISLGYSMEYINLSPELAGLRADSRFTAATKQAKR